MTKYLAASEPLDEFPPKSQNKTLASLWMQFNAQFPTDADCFEELYKRALEEHILICRNCENSEFQRKYGDRLIVCKNCKKKMWFTARTLFSRARHAKPWLAAVWLMERGVLLSSSRFHKLVGIAQSSALNILRKISTVIESCTEESAATVPSSYFLPILCRRSRETPARAHPNAEQATVERSWFEHQTASESSEYADHRTSSLIQDAFDSSGSSFQSMVEVNSHERLSTTSESGQSANDLSAPEKKVVELLSETPIQFDTLCQHLKLSAGELSGALILLELKGVARRLPGDKYVHTCPGQNAQTANQLKTDSGAWSAKATTAFIEQIRLNYQGISRKYLQNYLAALWCHFHKHRWQQGSLLIACLNFRPITYRELLSYVTPYLVKVSPLA